MSLRGLSEIWEPGQNIRDPVSICSTMTPPLHLLVIFPIIGSFFSNASTSLSHPFILSALLADTITSPFLSSILSNKTEILLPTFKFSNNPKVFISLTSTTGSDFSPSINKKTNFSVILVTFPSIILPSAIFFVFESCPFKSSLNSFEAVVSKELYISINFLFFLDNIFYF